VGGASARGSAAHPVSAKALNIHIQHESVRFQ
jgi:hypothetical protein